MRVVCQALLGRRLDPDILALGLECLATSYLSLLGYENFCTELRGNLKHDTIGIGREMYECELQDKGGPIKVMEGLPDIYQKLDANHFLGCLVVTTRSWGVPRDHN